MSAPTTGPTAESRRSKTPYNLKHFWSLIEFMQKWRNADYEDMITLHRSQAIEIIEGVNVLRAALDEIAAMDPKGIRADDFGCAARIAKTCALITQGDGE
jgi:hypothetical protein